MMSKIMPVLLVAVLVSACMGGEEVAQTTGGQEPREPTPRGGSAVTPATQKTSGGVADKITDLAAALSSGVAYKCTYRYEGMQTEAWVKGEKSYTKSRVQGKLQHSMTDGVWMYTWSEGEKEGVKYNLAEMEKMSDVPESDGPGYVDMGETADAAVDVDCRPDVIADSMFVPPSNVEFMDMGEFLKQLQDLQGMAGNLPGM